MKTKKLLNLLRIFVLIFAMSLVSISVGCGENIITNSDKECTVTFDSNGGSSVSSVTVKSGSLIEEPSVTRDYYEFVSWTYNGKDWDFSKDTVKGNITLVANWYADTHSVVFNKNGGSGSTEDGEFISGVEYTIPEFNITRNGYKFIGWSYNNKIYKANDKIVLNSVRDVEMVASFNRIYTISFDSNGGSGESVTQGECEAGSDVTLIKNNYKLDKYIFMGWSLSKDGDVEYLDESLLKYDFDKDITLYAIWREDKPEVDYVALTINKINEIGEVTYGSVDAINDARSSYTNLKSSEKEKVSNIDILKEAEAKLAYIYIDVLQNDTFTKKDCEDARSYYDKVTVDKREFVTNIDLLLIAEFVIDNKDKIDNVNNNLEDVVVSNAYKYYYQSAQIQYDQYNARRNIDATAEMATSEKVVYLDCSSFVNGVFHNALGVDVTSLGKSTQYFNQYAMENSSNADVLYAINTSDYPSSTSQKELLNKIYSELKAGDIVTYRHGGDTATAGHVMFYIGNGKFLHGTGASTKMTSGTYNPDNFTDTQTTTEKLSGSIQLLNASEVFTNTSSTRYLFRNTGTDRVHTFNIIRVLNREGLTVTNHGLNEYLTDGITFEKKANVNLYNSVRRNQEVEYTIEIVNKGNNRLNNLYVQEFLSDYVTMVSASNDGNYIDSKREIIWKLPTIGTNETITLSYKVKVNSSEDITGKVIRTQGNVCGVMMNELVNPISSDLSTTSVTIEAGKLIGQTFDTNIDFIKTVYKNAWDVELFNGSISTEKIIKGILDGAKITPTSKNYGYLAGDMYGGIKVNANSIGDNRTLKLLKHEYLEEGDVILAYTSYRTQYNCYIYLNEKVMIGCNNKVTKLTTSVSEVDKLLTTFAAYDRFLVLRPSLVH